MKDWRKLSTPWAILVVGVLWCAAYLFVNWPLGYAYHPDGPRFWRIEKSTGKKVIATPDGWQQ